MTALQIPDTADLLLSLHHDYTAVTEAAKHAANLNGDGEGTPYGGTPVSAAQVGLSTEEEPWYQLQNILQQTPPGDGNSYRKFYSGFRSLNDDTVFAIANDFQNTGQLASAAYTAQRESIIHQLEQRMYHVLGERQRSDVSMEIPLAWEDYVPGGPAEMYFNHYDENGELHLAPINTPDEAVAFAGYYSHQDVDTNHPTYSDTRKTDKVISSLITSWVKRSWLLAKKEVTGELNEGDYEQANLKYRESMAALMKEERMPTTRGKFMVREEIEHVVSGTVNNQLNGRSALIKQHLTLLRYRFGPAWTPQHSLDFVDAINIQSVNWGGNDGDGNLRIFREHPLYALVHQATNMSIGYPITLKELNDLGCSDPFLEKLSSELTAMREALKKLRAQLRGREEPNGDITLSNEEFEKASNDLNQICRDATGGKTWSQFTQEYAEAAKKGFEANPNANYYPELLMLRKNLMASGMSGCDNQPRRNSVWIDEVFQVILRKMEGMENVDFVKMSEDERKPLLNELFKPENQEKLQAIACSSVDGAGSFAKDDRDYLGKNGEVLKALHTLQALWLSVVQHPESHHHFVLAETERKSSYPLTLLLQICARGLGKGPENSEEPKPIHWLQPVGLYEDQKNLPRWTEVFEGAINDYPFFRDLIVDVWKGKIIIMMGHSDLARHCDRGNASGPLFTAILDKAKGFLKLEGKEIVSSSGKTARLDFRLFHGFSISDSWRSGLLDVVRFMVDSISAKGWMQFVQGIDRRNYHNTAASSKRAMETQMTQAAKIWAGQAKLQTDADFDLIVCEALSEGAIDYQQRHYKGLMPRTLTDMHPINGDFNTSSRATVRGIATKAKCLWKRVCDVVALGSARAISVSTTMFVGTNDAGGYKCADHVRKVLTRKIEALPDPLREKLVTKMRQLSFDESEPGLIGDNGLITPLVERTLYSLSHVYKHRIQDVQIGIRRSELKKRVDRQQVAAENGFDRDLPTQMEFDEYCAGAESVCDALGLLRPPGSENPPSLETCSLWNDYFKTTVMPIKDIGSLEPLMTFGYALYDYLKTILVNANFNGEYALVGRCDGAMRHVLNAMGHIGISPPAALSDLGVLRIYQPAPKPSEPAPIYQKLTRGPLDNVLAA